MNLYHNLYLPLTPASKKILIIAIRAVFGSARAPRLDPPVAAIATHECPDFIDHLVISTFDIDGLPADQGIRNYFSGLLNNPTESCPGDVHVATGLFMGHTEKIGKPYGLAFIHR
jgi:hypothetical protein